MTTALSVKLVRGTLTVDLNAAPFEIAEGFTPPAALVHPIIASGTSANRYGGGTVVGRQATDRGFSFGVHIDDASAGAIETAARRLQFMLDQAGDPDNPLYLVYRSTTDTALPPLWGQSALYYEVSFGTLTLTGMYSVSDLRGRALPNCNVSLTLKPYATGAAQLVATATGGILPDQWGTADGAERGVIVPLATTNKMTNPVFGAATYNTGWTQGAQIISSQNTNPLYCLPQTQSSVLIQCSGAGNTYRQTINVGNTNTHWFSALVMRPDLAAVTAADCNISYNAALGSSYLNLGNGLWLVYATAAGINAGTITGLNVLSGHSIYLLAYQCEEAAVRTPLGWGDLLGWAWTGTAHASASTRTAAQLKLPISDTTLTAAMGSIAVVVRLNNAISDFTADAYFFQDTGANISAYIQQASGKLNFTGAGLAGSALTNVAGDVLVLHYVWGASVATVYLNGVSVATGAWTPPTFGANLYLGSGATQTNYSDVTFMDFRTYNYALSAAEALNDYNNLKPQATNATRMGAIPWEWSNAGNNVFSPGTGIVNTVQKYNWGVFGGIPGSAPAITQLKITSSQALTTDTNIFLSRMAVPFFYDLVGALFQDLSGTADVATSIGDAFLVGSVNTNAISSNTSTLNGIVGSLIGGKELYVFMRLKDAGANLTIGFYWGVVSGGQLITSDYLAVAPDATMRLFKTVPFIVPRLNNLFPPIGTSTTTQIVQNLKRSSAGAANVSSDFFTMMLRPLTQIVFNASVNGTIILVRGNTARTFSSAAVVADVATVAGDIFELEPGSYNIVQSLFGSIASAYPVTTTLTFTSTWVTPRYALL